MKLLAIIAAAALAGVPAAAAAHPGNGHPQPGRERAADDGAAAAPNRCVRLQRVGFVAHGTFVSFAGDALVMNVVRANHHARAYTSGTPLSTKGAKVTFRGLTGFDQAVSTDRVTVIGKLLRPKHGCSGDPSVVLRKVMVQRTGQPGDSREAPTRN